VAISILLAGLIRIKLGLWKREEKGNGRVSKMKTVQEPEIRHSNW
jgi:hypothetical protein